MTGERLSVIFAAYENLDANAALSELSNESRREVERYWTFGNN